MTPEFKNPKTSHYRCFTRHNDSFYKIYPPNLFSCRPSVPGPGLILNCGFFFPLKMSLELPRTVNWNVLFFYDYIDA